jgi:hypothetical protein
MAQQLRQIENGEQVAAPLDQTHQGRRRSGDLAQRTALGESVDCGCP